MDVKLLQRLIGEKGRARLDRIFSGKAAARTAFFETAAEVFTEKGVSGLSAFLEQKRAEDFLVALIGKTVSSGAGVRATTIYHILFTRLELEIDPTRIAEVACELHSKYFRETEKIFFMLPVDADGYRQFLGQFVRIGEYDPDLLRDFVLFVRSQEAVYLRKDYAYHPAVLTKVMESVLKVYLLRRTPVSLRNTGEFFGERCIDRFVRASTELEQHGEFLQLLQKILMAETDYAIRLSAIKTYFKRYLKGTDGGKLLHSVFLRLLTIWPVVVLLEETHVPAFREFLKQYGNARDEMESAIWDIVFTLAPEKAILALHLFSGSAFRAVISAYAKDRKTIIFLAQNIVTALSEADIRSFSKSLHRIALKLLLGLKVDPPFLERRAGFFAWLIEETTSQLIAAEVVRFLFFEYIYIALKLVENRRGLTMTKFCESNHNFFCSRVDAKGCGVSQYYEILEKLRERLYEPIRQCFPEQRFALSEVFNIAQSTKNEDLALSSLPQIAPGNFVHYHAELMAQFKKNPELIAIAFLPDYWCRLSLSQAMTHVQAAAFPLVGAVRIIAGEGGAYTDGHTIFLPESYSGFQEKPDELLDNRNLTMYVALALHEAGHLIAGSFRFNIAYYLARLENPELFKSIHNTFEDYRIETFLRKIDAHPQVKEILECMNETFSYQHFEGPEDLALDLLLYIYCTADGTLKIMEGRFRQRFAAIFTAKVFCGTFGNLRELADYGINALKNMEIGNPLGAYPVSREFYEIMKHWPDSDTESLTQSGARRTGQHMILGNDENGRPLTAEDLQRLYADYNLDPRGFLQRHELPIFPQLLPEGTVASGDEEADPRQDRFAADILKRSEPSLIDDSTRTAADDLLASEQMRQRQDHPPPPPDERRPKNNKRLKRAPKTRQSFVYSVDARTRSRTRLSQIKEFRLRQVQRTFMDKMRKWRGLEEKIFRMLAMLLPEQRFEDETSYFEGDVDMELLIETLADRKKTGVAEFLETQVDKKRSLAVAIGIDCSGSTNQVVGDVDPADMTTIQSTDPDSRGRVLIRETPETLRKYDSIHDLEKVFALLMGRALKYLTQDVTLYGFNSATGTNVYRADSLEAASAFEAQGNNRDGDFVRYITSMLVKNPAEIKFFFLVSDGQPRADNYRGEAAIRDTMLSIREAVQAGIKFIYFNIDLQRSVYFDEFAAEATYAEYFSNPYQLPAIIPTMVRRIVETL